MERLVANMRIGVKPFLALGPALLGMLPMPGGALLSAPLLERGATNTPAEVKAAANVWFRHALLLVYPLGPALIASAKIAELNVYRLIPFQMPAFLLTLFLGYAFLLRRARGKVGYSGRFSWRGLLVPLLIILIAPILDLLLKSTASLPYPEISTALGVGVSLLVAVVIGRLRYPSFKKVLWKMRPWKFSLIILAMFAFLNVFKASGTPESIASLSPPPIVLCIVIGFALGLVTGRIQTPTSIIIPIFLSIYGAMSPAAFALTYFAVFLGYIVTPIHPCISVSLEYFSTSMSVFIKKMAPPLAVALLITLLLGLWLL